jgi:ubiquinone/menaquinone biosynthesis C-methylase UbiE
MHTVADHALEQVLLPNTSVRLIEPKIYSTLPDDEVDSSYDTDFGDIYDKVACNPVYNRIMWGYSIKRYDIFVREALRESGSEYILDLASGSLAFTARTYIQQEHPPVILSDQSLKMLRMAKARVEKIHGRVPDNIVFLVADALQSPFRSKSFGTIIALNLIHCLEDLDKLLASIEDIAKSEAKMYFTTLIEGNRISNKYLRALANSGKLVYRDIDQINAFFCEVEIPMAHELYGNLAFIRASKSANKSL